MCKNLCIQGKADLEIYTAPVFNFKIYMNWNKNEKKNGKQRCWT